MTHVFGEHVVSILQKAEEKIFGKIKRKAKD